MPRYTWQWDYRSSLTVGVAGESTDMPDELAEAVNRDSPGVLVAESETPSTAERAVDEPPHDRMVRGAQTRKAGRS